MARKARTPKNQPIKVECIIRFATDERMALISKDGNNSMCVVFGDDREKMLSRKKLQELISSFNLKSSNQLKGKMVNVLANDDCSAIFDIFAR